ncbi:MAG: hypothetical protein DRG20_04815 [Deltaproteobacteria bacterium]|nr:Rrf2 family transcriptional regulator [Deltaproteobacteria bacterium]RLA89354.1 MAG: hypothetical protein DRG20_04815 [Deltaproteobacteria bacterium]
MQISTRTRYGLRALLDISLHSSNRPVLLKEIVERQSVSKAYLEQLILSLQSAGLIRSIRGKKGGFLLAKPPTEIKMSEVIKTLERSFSFVECVDHQNICPRNDHCVAQMLWRRVTNLIRKELENITLDDLIRWEKEKIKHNE